MFGATLSLFVGLGFLWLGTSAPWESLPWESQERTRIPLPREGAQLRGLTKTLPGSNFEDETVNQLLAQGRMVYYDVARWEMVFDFDGETTTLSWDMTNDAGRWSFSGGTSGTWFLRSASGDSFLGWIEFNGQSAVLFIDVVG